MGEIMAIRTLSLAAAAALFVTAASADAVKGTGFSVTFPCQAKLLNQVVPAGKVTIPITNHSCEKNDGIYYVVVSTFPKGFIAKKTVKAAFVDAVGGAASNVKGKVRANNPIALGGVAGRDALIDVKSAGAAVHLRVFFVGDKQYAVMVVGAAGQESAKPAMAFLNSFKLGK
jgi:hypothetical protein